MNGQDNLLDMAVLAMLTAYRCIERGDREAAKSTLADFMSTWAGMASVQSGTPLQNQALVTLRSSSAEFPVLSKQIEDTIREWQSKNPEQILQELEKELGEH